MKNARVVCSLAGRDKGSLLAVISEANGYILVADGKARPLNRPKRKNPKHLMFSDNLLSEKDLLSNQSLRRALKRCIIKEDS